MYEDDDFVRECLESFDENISTIETDIDTIFAGFSKDWGGEGTPEEIAASLRENSLEAKDIEMW